MKRNVIKTNVTWRDNYCTLLSKRKKCEYCRNLTKVLLQRKLRSTKGGEKKRFNLKCNKIDKQIVLSLNKKLKREKRFRKRLQIKIQLLNKALEESHDKIASLKDNNFEKLCNDHNISGNEKLTLKEIVNASKSKPAGRRYSHEWIMLCMLMNIRSPTMYEFLRKTDVIPLPCTRTIRSYFSLIDTKCGFDNDFAKLLEKHFSLKTPMQRHGMIVMDEINLRKSISVSSKDLTYKGLVDFGDVGPKTSSIDEQATHGLVLMF